MYMRKYVVLMMGKIKSAGKLDKKLIYLTSAQNDYKAKRGSYLGSIIGFDLEQ